MLADDAHRDRRAEVWHVLVARQWESSPTWAQLFDDLTPDRAARLGELYDVLPDGARVEYDVRYGGPPEAEPGGPARKPAGEDARWRSARTLTDLGELTAQFLEGKLAQTPSHRGPPDPETNDLISLLAAVNRADFVTRHWQAAELPADGREQRAAVSGFADDETFTRLMTSAAGADLIISAARAAEDDGGPMYCITREYDRENTWDGGARSCQSLRDDHAGSCHPDAVDALIRAWQITLIDPQWGRNDHLWPVLDRFAASWPQVPS